MTRAKADGSHPGPSCSLESKDRIFDHSAVFRCGAQAFGGEKEEIGCGFATVNLDGTADDVEMSIETDPFKGETDFVGMSG